MRRRSATTGLIAKASLVLHKTVVVLSHLDLGMAMRKMGTAAKTVAS